jgi:hypothetical protein
MYRVYEANIAGRTARFSCSDVREISLRQQIERGEVTIEPNSMVLLLETPNRNEARRMASEI